MEKINTVIFDMDGTTLDTLIDLADSVNHVLKEYNMPLHSLDDYRHYFSNGIRHSISLAVIKNTKEEVIDEMVKKFRSYYDIHCLDHTKPYDGIVSLLKKLKERGYKIAIVSNKIDSAVQELHERFFKDCVDVSIGERKGMNRKPSPDMVNEALKLLRSDIKEAVYVGDSEVDYQTSVNSNLPCILVTWGFRDKEQLEKFKDTYIVNHPHEILNALDALNKTI